MKWLTIWFKKLYHGGNTRKGCFIMGTLFFLFTWLHKSIISINLGEPVIIAFLYNIPFCIMYATPLFLGGILKYPKSRGKKDP